MASNDAANVGIVATPAAGEGPTVPLGQGRQSGNKAGALVDEDAMEQMLQATEKLIAVHT